MSSRASLRVFWLACATLLCVAALGWISVFIERAAANEAEQSFESKRENFVHFVDTVGGASSSLLEAEQRKVRELDGLEVQLRSYLLTPGDAGALKPESSRPADLVFRLQALMDSLGREAQLHGIILRNRSNAFGFDAILKNAMPPSASELELVSKQCQLMEVLGRYLVTSGPEQILSVQREANLSLDSRRSDETFIPQSAMISRIKEQFNVICFRFSFLGNTQSLRTFLNQIAESPWAFFVANVSATRPETRLPLSAVEKPVVEGGSSEYQVVVAWVEEVS